MTLMILALTVLERCAESMRGCSAAREGRRPGCQTWAQSRKRWVCDCIWDEYRQRCSTASARHCMLKPLEWPPALVPRLRRSAIRGHPYPRLPPLGSRLAIGPPGLKVSC